MAVITAVDAKGRDHRRLFTTEQITAGDAERWKAQIAKKQGGYKKTRSTRRLKTDSTRRRKRSKQ